MRRQITHNSVFSNITYSCATFWSYVNYATLRMSLIYLRNKQGDQFYLLVWNALEPEK